MVENVGLTTWIQPEPNGMIGSFHRLPSITFALARPLRDDLNMPFGVPHNPTLTSITHQHRARHPHVIQTLLVSAPPSFVVFAFNLMAFTFPPGKCLPSLDRLIICIQKSTWKDLGGHGIQCLCVASKPQVVANK